MKDRTFLQKLAYATIPVVLVLAFVAGVTLTGPVDAAPSQEIDITYYSDASKTEIIGWKLFTCFSGTYSSGETSAYFDRYTTPCY